ncbi:MAG: hypothetical protein HY695_01605 [Deltaproteobacteria bacterium]|nr:hypothetical protein [Deltaproteobacteria bacterium]
MSKDFIPDDIAQFILQRIDSVAQMEALVLLCRNADEEWAIEALAKRLYISEQETTEILEHLCKDGLLLRKSNEPLRYQYQPDSGEIQELVNRVVDTYTRHLVPVTNLIHSAAKTRVREFADAFRFRKDE